MDLFACGKFLDYWIDGIELKEFEDKDFKEKFKKGIESLNKASI